MKRARKTKNVLGVGTKTNNEQGDGEFFLGGKHERKRQEKKAALLAR
jgi:hypothetical protein